MAVLLQRLANSIPTMGASTAGSDSRLHPFFSSPHPQPVHEEQHDALQTTTSTTDLNSAIDPELLSLPKEGQQAEAHQISSKKLKRKSEAEATPGNTGKRGRGRPKKSQSSTDAPRGVMSVSCQHSQGPLDNSLASNHTLQESAENIRRSSPSAIPPACCNKVAQNQLLNPAMAIPADFKSDIGAKPKRMLNFNVKSGTLGSPPNPKESPPKKSPDSKPMRARGTRIPKRSSMIVSVNYGTDEQARLRIGNKIKEILNAQRLHDPAPTIDTTKESASQKYAQAEIQGQKQPVPGKKTHPFFLAKTQKTNVSAEIPAVENKPQDSTTQKVFTSTPCSPKRPRAQPLDSLQTQTKGKGQIQFGTRHLGLKIPGACLPPWPWKGAVRIGEDVPPGKEQEQNWCCSWKKSKGNATLVKLGESIVTRMTAQLQIPRVMEEIRNVDSDKFTPAPRELRLPRKHCESGRKLQERVRNQLKTLESDLGTARFFESIKSSLAAHDRSQCESQAWTQKYAPGSVSDVLQADRETKLLKQWLMALQVQSVDTGADSGVARGKGGPKGVDAGQKRRKRRKLENFIVSSDEDEDELNELSEPENESCTFGHGSLSKRTVIRTCDAKAGKDIPRLKNAIVISGPHGCGKTAAVYAVAKELGFEVFEISPGSRRNGKDILEKIGDMTRNHLVQHHQANTVKAGNDDGNLPIDDGVAEDVQSGKQATMGSFFKLNTKSKPPTERQSGTKLQASSTKQSEPRKAASKIQKQSLILLEEVDILYEEDKGFWSTVLGLMAQSKRPFIMTCNDESLVPLQTLDLHGIFRFNSPPINVAVDRLLIMAAHEGHALKRGAVESLYVSRGQDMRASIADLNYWCQIGVGDRRGGFDWFFLRWPKGIDRDEAGDVVRVVSEDTYQEGMGWLDRTPALEGSQDGGHGEEALMQHAWHHFGLDLGLWQDSENLQLWAKKCHGNSGRTSSAERLASLEAYDDFANIMSIADLSSAMESMSFKELPIDAKLPPLPSKARDDYILGRVLLEAMPITSYDTLDTSISVCLKAMGKKQLCNIRTGQDIILLEEKQVIPAIRNHLNGQNPSAPAVNRLDFAIAFDPIAVSDEAAAAAPSSHLDPSVWDRTMKIITLDVAPFVRDIVAFDHHLQQQRMKLGGSLMSQGGAGPKKRMRTTRAAYSAMEGGQRSTTRAEKWFKADINPYLVKATAPRGCADFVQIPAVMETDERSVAGEIAGLGSSCDESEPAIKHTRRNKLRNNVVGASSDCSGDESAI